MQRAKQDSSSNYMENTSPSTNTAPRAPRPNGPRTGGPRGAGRGGRPGDRKGGPRKGGRPERVKPEFEQKTLSIRRVTRVVSGGRRFSFSVALVIGDRKGSVGIGLGKAGDTTLAMQKAFNDAKKNLMKVRLTDAGTIDHDVTAKYKSARVMLMPNTGRGVVVGSAMRIVVELAGITDITGRVISGTKNKMNIARATAKALATFAMPKKGKTITAEPVAA